MMLCRLIEFARQFNDRDGVLFALHKEARRLEVSKRTLTRAMKMLEAEGYSFEYDKSSQMYWGKCPTRRLL